MYDMSYIAEVSDARGAGCPAAGLHPHPDRLSDITMLIDHLMIIVYQIDMPLYGAVSYV